MARLYPADGGFAKIMNTTAFDERFAKGSTARIYMAAMTTELSIDGAYLARRLKLSHNTILTDLKRLMDWGYVIRAEMRNGQRKSYDYLFLGVDMSLDEGKVDPEDSWTQQAYAEARKRFPTAVAFYPPAPALRSQDPGTSELDDEVLRYKLSGTTRVGPEDLGTSTQEGVGKKGREEVSVEGSLRSPSPSREGEATTPTATSIKPTRKTVSRGVQRRARSMADALLDDYNQMIRAANEADGGSRYILGENQRREVKAFLDDSEVARHLLSDWRDALWFAVHGNGEYIEPLRLTGSGSLLRSWLEQAMSAVKTVDLAGVEELRLDQAHRTAQTVPSFDEVPRRQPTVGEKRPERSERPATPPCPATRTRETPKRAPVAPAATEPADEGSSVDSHAWTMRMRELVLGDVR
jgi:biotin operon repressor